MRKLFATLAIGVLTLTGSLSAQKPFFSTELPEHAIEAEVHAVVGSTGITQNYLSQLPGMVKADAHPGAGFGVGGRVSFVLRDYLALRTGVDLVWGGNRCTMTLLDNETQEVDNIYLSNRYTYARVPVVMSFRFNVVPHTRWFVDGGFYFATGLGGKQKADIYSTTVNAIGQLITKHRHESWKYFSSDGGLIHSTHTFDFGLHFGTGFVFREHYSIGVMMSYGLKDAAHDLGYLNGVSVHNIDWLCRLGYQF